jgi:tetratricopeptide (TPR) repeat protein
MFYAPARGMAEVRERAPLGPAVVLAFVAHAAYLIYVLWPYLFSAERITLIGLSGFASVAWEAAGSLLFTAIVFVPVVIFVSNIVERRAGYGITFRQEYAPVASAVFYARAMASLLALPFAALVRASGIEALSYPQAEPMLSDIARQNGTSLGAILAAKPLLMPLSFASTIMFPLLALWLIVAVRESLRVSWLRAFVVVLIGAFLMFPLTALLGPVFERVVASPFLLLVLFFMMRGYFGEVMRGRRARAAFRQNLEASTLNPADASAHYNLGLLHAQRGEYDEARERFRRAIEIDPEETDSHYQLGRIARAQGRLPEAIRHFGEVVTRDDSHAQHEIWREVGATYIAAGQYADARDALQRFLDRRSSDPEGLYLMGRAAFGLGQLREAKEWMAACVEAVRTAPAYKYRADKRWLNEAQQFLRTQA